MKEITTTHWDGMLIYHVVAIGWWQLNYTPELKRLEIKR